MLAPEIQSLTAHLDLNPGASEAAINEFLTHAGSAVPRDYLDFLRVANVGETNIDRDVGYSTGLWRLWPVEQIVELTQDYFFDREGMQEVCQRHGDPFLPDGQWPWIIGDTGADTAFCLHPRFRPTRYNAARYGCLEFYQCDALGTKFI